MTRFYDMHDDLHVPGRWHLTDPTDRNGRSLDHELAKARRIDLEGPVRLVHSEFAERGRPVDYSELAGIIAPVVHVRVARLLTELAPSDVQVLLAEIEGQAKQFCVINVIREVQCIDDERCTEVEYYTPRADDGSLGAARRYASVIGLRIDPAKVRDEKIFRTWGWSSTIIVSDEIKQGLERIGTVGVRFTEV